MSFQGYATKIAEPARRGIVTPNELAYAFFNQLGNLRPQPNEIRSAIEQLPATALPEFRRVIREPSEHELVLVHFRIGDSRSFYEKMDDARANRVYNVIA